MPLQHAGQVRGELESPDGGDDVEPLVGAVARRRADRPRRTVAFGTRAGRAVDHGRCDVHPHQGRPRERHLQLGQRGTGPTGQVQGTLGRSHPGQCADQATVEQPSRLVGRLVVASGELLEVRPGPVDRPRSRHVGRRAPGDAPRSAPARQSGRSGAGAGPLTNGRESVPVGWGRRQVAALSLDETRHVARFARRCSRHVGLATPPTSLKPVIDVLPDSVYDNPTWRGMAYFLRDAAMYVALLVAAGRGVEHLRGGSPSRC